MKLSLKFSKGKVTELVGEFLGSFFLLFVLFVSPLILRGNEPLLVGLFFMALLFVFGVFSKGHFNPLFTIADFLVVVYEALKSKDYSKVKEEAIKMGGYLAVQLLAGIVAFALAYRLRDQLLDYQLVAAGYADSPEVKDQLISSVKYGTSFDAKFQNLAFVLEMFFSMALVLFSQITAKYYKSVRPFVLGLAIFTFMVFLNDITGASFNPFRSIVAWMFLPEEYGSTVWLYIAAPLLGTLFASGIFYGLTVLKPQAKKD